MKKVTKAWLKLLTTGTILGFFTAIGVSMVILVHQATTEQIAENQRQATYRAFDRILQGEVYDNSPLDHPLTLLPVDELNGGEPVTIYTAKSNGKAIATLLSIDAQRGYNGKITLLIGVLADGSLSGVEVVNHHETPGLGDKIESRRSDWLKQFEGRSLEFPDEDSWGVKRDGGSFDQITGATVTSRAVVMSLKQALTYLQQLQPELFEQPASYHLHNLAQPVEKQPVWQPMDHPYS
ncbi:MAG: electron transport complex subunit RsxG, partial [Candidatus Thiodiazotropha sp.]